MSPYGRTAPTGRCMTRLTEPYCMFVLAKKSVGTPSLPSTGVAYTGIWMFFSPRPL